MAPQERTFWTREADQPLLSVRSLSLYVRSGRARVKIVEDVSFDLGRGEFFALVGESGSGKTMIARAIMRLLPIRILEIEGELRFEGTDLAALPEGRMRRLRGARIAMIFQEPMTSLNPLMTVGAQIDEALRLHGGGTRTERRERILKLLADVRFRDPARAAAMYPHELSGGMRQRAMIAMALSNDPALLIADEPTTALDVTLQQEVMEILVRLRETYQLSVLFISHDLALVHRYADRIGVLYGGVLMESGPAAEVIRRPAHPYTAALLSCTPRRRHAGEQQKGIEGVVPSPIAWLPGCRFAPRCPQRVEACSEGRIEAEAPANKRMARCLRPLQ